MNAPRYAFWQAIQPVVGQPIPVDAEWSESSAPDCWDSHYEYSDVTTFTEDDLQYNWRVLQPVIPEQVAVDAIMAGFSYSDELRIAGRPHLSVSFAGGLRASSQEELRNLILCKLREFS